MPELIDTPAALEKALAAILDTQKSGTGFYDAMTWVRSEFGWQLCKASPGNPDACSNWFYPFSVALAGEFLGDKLITDAKWHHHTTYGHCVKRPPVIK